MVNSRDLKDLDPYPRAVCNDQLARCHADGIEIIITSTWRDFDGQAAMWAIGRTVHVERRVVTNARPGYSWHQYKAAWDLVPIVGGKCVWDEHDPLWKEVVKHGKEAGAEAGADWPTFKDLPHFEVRPKIEGLHISLDEAMVRFREHGTIFV